MKKIFFIGLVATAFVPFSVEAQTFEDSAPKILVIPETEHHRKSSLQILQERDWSLSFGLVRMKPKKDERLYVPEYPRRNRDPRRALAFTFIQKF